MYVLPRASQTLQNLVAISQLYYWPVLTSEAGLIIAKRLLSPRTSIQPNWRIKYVAINCRVPLQPYYHTTDYQQSTHLFVCDVVQARSLERGPGGILKQFWVMARVDDQSIDPLGVAKLGAAQENLIRLDWLQLPSRLQLEVTGELIETLVGSLTLHMPLG